jgi:nucleotide-binding universal stress UspA family protein
MTHVLCAIDGSPASSEAASAAIALARDGASLSFVGVVRPEGDVQPGYGELLRRRAAVDHALTLAVQEARRAGLAADSTVQAGDPVEILGREAQGTVTEEAVLVHASGRRFSRQRRVQVSRLTANGRQASNEDQRLQEAA